MSNALPLTAPIPSRIDDYHFRIEAALDRKLRALAGDRDARAAVIAQARWELVRVLREYQLFKHGRIFDPAIAGPDPRVAERAAELKARCVAAGETYKAHVRRWSVTGGELDWPAYEGDLRRAVQAILSHLAQEGRGIRALIGA